MASLVAQEVVLSTEGDNPNLWTSPHQARDSIRIEPCAVNQVPRANFPPLRDQNESVWCAQHRAQTGVHRDFDATPLYFAGNRASHFSEIHGGGVRGVDRREARGVGLHLAQPLGADLLHAGNAVGRSSPQELIEPRQFVLVCSDNDLPPGGPGNVPLLAESDQPFGPLYAE